MEAAALQTESALPSRVFQKRLTAAIRLVREHPLAPRALILTKALKSAMVETPYSKPSIPAVSTGMHMYICTDIFCMHMCSYSCVYIYVHVCKDSRSLDYGPEMAAKGRLSASEGRCAGSLRRRAMGLEGEARCR